MTGESGDGSFTRRTVLRSGAVAGGALALGGAASGSAAATTVESESDEKRGGRGQIDGDADRNRPFTLADAPTGVARNASCMSEESAEQTYLEYEIQYCDSDDDSDATLYVIPDEAELAQQEVYEFRAIQECRDSENQLVAFGPTNQDVDC